MHYATVSLHAMTYFVLRAHFSFYLCQEIKVFCFFCHSHSFFFQGNEHGNTSHVKGVFHPTHKKKKIKIKSSHADSLASIAQASSIIHGGEWDFNRVYSIEKFNSIFFFPESSFLILRIIHNLNSFQFYWIFYFNHLFFIIIIVNLWLKKIWR